MNRKKISGLLALAMVFSIVSSPMANAVERKVEKTISEDSKEKVEIVNYVQNFDDGDVSNWTKKAGGGSFEAAEQGLRIQGGNAFTSPDGKQYTLVTDDESPLVQNGVIETDLKVRSHAGRLATVFRYVDKGNYDAVGYDVSGNWNYIKARNGNESTTPLASGVHLNDGTNHTLRIEFMDENLNLIVDGTSIYKGEVLTDAKPGQIGFRAWGYDGNYSNAIYDNLTLRSVSEVELDKTSVYVPYPEIGQYDIDVNLSTLENPLKTLSTSKGDLILGEDYLVDGTKITIKSSFIEKVKDNGTTDVSFNFEDGFKAIFKLQVQASPDENVTYLKDFTTEGIDGMTVVKGEANVTYENSMLKMTTSGDAIIIDENSPNLYNSEVEFVVNPTNDNGNLGVVLRYAGNDSWTYIGKDGASAAWGSGWHVKNSKGESRKLIDDSARIYHRRVEPYKMKFRVVEDVLTVYLDDAEIFNGVVPELTSSKGKTGFRFHGNSGGNVQYLSVETQKALEPSATEFERKEIASDNMTVGFDSTFPRVLDYTLTSGKTLGGQAEQNYEVEINTKKYVPVVTSSFTADTATYHMAIDELGMSFDVVYKITGNVLNMSVENIDESQTKLYTINFPQNSMVSVNSSQEGAMFKGANYEHEEEYMLSDKTADKTHSITSVPVIVGDGIAASLTNSSIKAKREVAYQTYEEADGTLSTGLWTNEFMHRGLLDGEVIAKPEAKVAITEDRNNDGTVDYFDGAIAYRDDIKQDRFGIDIVQNSYSSVAMNVGSVAQYPFLRILDNVKKFNLGTDGFEQNIIIKGYQSEGHDSAHPDFANINQRAGGEEDFRKLLEESENYNANIGIHINHTEAYPEARQFNDNLVSDVGGWSWYDSARHIIRENDILDKENGMEKRLDDLAAMAPGLDMVYVDVYDDSRWPAHKLGKKLNELGWAGASEYAPALSQYSVWGHQLPGDYNKAGDLIRFVNHQEQEIFGHDQLFRGQPSAYRVNGIFGWQGSADYNATIEDFYVNVLPNKFLMNFPMSKWNSEDRATLGDNNEVVTYMENGKNKITKDGKVVADGNKIFIPWSAQDESKIYHWNDANGAKEWDLPNSWEGLNEVYLYQLTDEGKVNEKVVEVRNNKITLNVDANTPYVLYKEQAIENDDMNWGEGSTVKDMGFDSHTWDYGWTKSTTASDDTHINFVNNNKGNTVVRIDGNDGADATISQTLTGLEGGKSYSASVWVEITGERMTEVSLTTPDGTVHTNYLDETNVNYGSTHNDKLNTKYQRVKLLFTQPEGETTAEFKINVAGGNAGTKVDLDDVRVTEVGVTDKGEHYFFEDFENVDQEYGPFVSTKSDNSHLSETNKPYTNDTIDGQFSLKIRSGDYMRTLPHRVRLEPNTTYKVGLSYLSWADNAFTLGVKSDKAKAAGDTTNAVVVSKNCSREGQVEVEFTTGNYDDYYIDLTKNAASEYIVDNLYVDKVSQSVDKAELESKIAEAEAISGDYYTEASFGALTSAINAGKEVLANNNATEEAVDSAVVAINDAIKGLEYVEMPTSKVRTLKAKTTSDSATLTWTAPKESFGITEYVVYKDGKEYSRVDANTLESSIDGLKANNIYNFKISAVYANGEMSGPTSVSARTKK